MADFLALVSVVHCDFVTFPFGIQGHVWYLTLSIPDHCCLSYFVRLGQIFLVDLRDLFRAVGTKKNK